MNRLLPKIKFKTSPIAKEARKLFSFCYPGLRKWDWSDRVYQAHPKLKDVLSGIEDKKAFYRKCYAYAKNFKKANEDKVEKSTKRFQKKWDRIGDKYLKILSEHFEIDWPKNRKVIKAYVSVVPINPRHLDKWSFTVRYEDKEKRMLRTAAHEILHFLYFEKWKEVFPDAERKTFDSPHLVWKLSEILAPVIMNCNPEIQRIVDDYSPGYKEFQDINIGRKKIMEFYGDLYKKHLKSKSPFAEFLRESWDVIEKNKAVLEKI